MASTKESDSGEKINIVVKDHKHDKKLYYRMRKDVPIRKVLVEFCKRRDLDYRTVKFLLNGSRVRPNLNPNQLNMESGDEIDVMSTMCGGNYEHGVGTMCMAC